MTISPDLTNRCKDEILQVVGSRGLLGDCLSNQKNPNWLDIAENDSGVVLRIDVRYKATAEFSNLEGGFASGHIERIVKGVQQEFPGKKIDVSFHGTEEPLPREDKPFERVVVKREKSVQKVGDILGRRTNPDYTLDNLFMTSSTQRATRAAHLVLEGAYITSNSLLVVGEPGTGKTHLLEALARERLTHGSVYVNGLQGFQEDYKQSAREHSSSVVVPDSIRLPALQNSLVAVVLDDVHQLSPTSNGTNDSFADTIDFLAARKITLIMATNLDIKELTTSLKRKAKEGVSVALERILSRIAGFPAVRLDMPNYEEAVQLTKFLIEKSKVPYSDLETIARAIVTYAQSTRLSPSYLIGTVNNLLLERELSTRECQRLDKEFVGQVLSGSSDFTLIPENPGKIREIIGYVSSLTGVPVDDLISGKRGCADISYAKSVGYYLCMDLAGQSSQRVASGFRLTHASVLHGANKIRTQLEEEVGLPEQDRKTTRLIAKACEELGYQFPKK